MYSIEGKPNNRWNLDSYRIGVEGEKMFYSMISAYIQDFPKPDIEEKKGDGGKDFEYRGVRLQIKTNYKRVESRVEHLKLALKDIERADVFILMSLHVDGRGRFEGFVVKEGIRSKLRKSEKFYTPYIDNGDLNKSIKDLVAYICGFN